MLVPPINIAKIEYKNPKESMQPSKVKNMPHCISPKRANIKKDNIPINSIIGARNSKKNQ